MTIASQRQLLLDMPFWKADLTQDITEGLVERAGSQQR